MPPLWRPALSDADKPKVIESRLLLPIALRAGMRFSAMSAIIGANGG